MEKILFFPFKETYLKTKNPDQSDINAFQQVLNNIKVIDTGEMKPFQIFIAKKEKNKPNTEKKWEAFAFGANTFNFIHK